MFINEQNPMSLARNGPRVLLAIAVILVAGALAVSGGKRGAASDADFLEMLVRVDAAQLELQNGRPTDFKALWSHSEDVTLSGGFGGTIEKGWDQISRRLDWVGAQFSSGTNRIERIVAHSSGELGYVVQIEHIRFRVPGQNQESERHYRVTMLFRHEADGWRIIHRQADSQMVKQAPK